VRGLEVGHRDDGEDMINRHPLFLPLVQGSTGPDVLIS
jgi:hypothetical protein